MTISSTTRKAGPFLGNGVTTLFPLGFKVFKKDDIKLLLIDGNGVSTTLTLDSQYSVALNADQTNSPGGTITYPIAGAPLSAGYQLVALGDLPLEQQTDITNSGGFYPDVVEAMVDRSTIQIQQVAELAGRAIVVTEAENTSPVLPPKAARANTLLGFDATGNIAAMPITASVGAGDMHDEIGSDGKVGFVAGTDFTAGVSDTLILSRAPGNTANVTIQFDAANQGGDQILSLVGATLKFTAPIPVGTQRVYVRTGTQLSLNTPAAGSILDTAVAAGTNLFNRVHLIVNAKDAPFNAIGDGVSNDTIAFQAIENSTVAGQVLDCDVPAGTYLLQTDVTAGAGIVNWRFASGAALTGAGKLAHHAAQMTYNASPNIGKRLSIWHGTTANPATDGTTPSAYIQRVDRSVTADDPGHLISALYVTHKRLTLGTGWLYGGYFYLEDQSNSTHAQSVAVAGAFHGTISGAGWGVYGEANAHSQFTTIQGAEFDCFNSSGVDYTYNHLSPLVGQPFAMGVWSFSTGGNRNTIAYGLGAGNSSQSTTNSWHVGMYMQPWSVIDYGIDIQAQPKVLINFENGASTDGTGLTVGGIGLDCGIGAAYGAGADQGAIHLRQHRLCFGSGGFMVVNGSLLEFWSAGARRGYIDLGGADHAL